MKTLPGGMQAHLDSGATTLCWCWKITRADGQVFGFTEHDNTLSFGGTGFEPDSGFSASEIRSGSDMSVDSQDAEGVLNSATITETDILDGRWDNAAIEVWRVNWADVAQRVLMRKGNIGQVRRGQQIFVAEVRSLSHVLNQTVGRTFQYYCDAVLGDARCGVDLESTAFKGAGSVLAVLSDRSFTASGLGAFASAWFDFGHVEWTSGANAGRKAEVASHVFSGGVVTVELYEAPVRAFTANDIFVIRAGCSKQFETCKVKFSNAVNFRGFPHMPGDDTVLRYANKGDANTGGVL